MGETINPTQENIEGLKGIRLDDTNKPRVSSVQELKSFRANDMLSTPAVSYAGYSGAGNSRYDRRQELTEENFYNLPNYRGEQQSAALQLANGIAKGVVLAGTTFLDGTVGLVLGAGEALSEGDASRLWDNDFSRAMKALNDASEQALPNYYTDDEKEKNFFQQMATSNFWGDKLLKNLGFTVGAFYSGSVFSKPLQAFNLLKNVGVGSTIASLTGATLSAVNEGRIEALNNSTDWFNLQKQQLDEEFNKKREKLEFFNNTTAYEGLINNLREDYNKKLEVLDNNRTKVGNADLIFNLPILLATNMIEFGKLYANGFNTAARLDKLSNYSTFGKYARAGLNSLSEGVEEMSQAIAADIAGNKYYNDKINLSFNRAQIDDEAEQQTVSWLNAAAKSLKDNLGSKDSWEEFGIGALTGFLGMPTFGKANNANAWVGKDKAVGISGGVIGEAREYQKEWDEAKEVNDRIENRIQSPEFMNYYHGLTRHNKFQNDMNKAAAAGRAKEFKDAEYAQMISDIQMFNTAGRIDDYVNMISNAFDTSDEGLQKIVEITTNKETGIGPFIDASGNPMYSTPEGKQEMINKLNESKKEMLSAVDIYRKTSNNIETIYGDKFTDDQKAELVWLSLLADNKIGRATSISNELKPYLNKIIEEKESNRILKNLNNPDSKALDTEDYLLNTVKELATMSPNNMVRVLVGNSGIRNYINNNLDAINFTGDKTIDQVKQDIKDIVSLFIESDTFSKKFKEYLNDPSKLEKEQIKEKKTEAKKIFNRKKKEVKDKIDNAATSQEIDEIRQDDSIDSDIKEKAIRESTNPIVEDNNEIHNRANFIKSKLDDITDAQLKSDVNYLVDLLEKNAKTVGDFNINNPIIEDINISLLDAPTIKGKLTLPSERAKAASQLLSDILNERKEINSGSSVVGPQTETSSDEEDEEPMVDDTIVDAPTAGSQEVGTTKPLPIDSQKSGKTIKTENMESVENNGDTDIYEKSDNVENIPNNKSKEEIIQGIRDNNNPIDTSSKEYVNPSSHQYKYSYNTNEGVQLIPIDAENEGEEAIRNKVYLEKNGAFDFINSGQLAQYKNNGGVLYFGIDPSLDNALPLLFVKVNDEYKPIGTLYKSKGALEKRGLTTITNNLLNNVKDSIYIDETNIITDYEVTKGRFGYDNTHPKSATTIINNLGVSPENAVIVVNRKGQLISSNSRLNAGNFANSGTFGDGMSGIAVPNALQGTGERDYTILPIIPKRVSQLYAEENENPYTKLIDRVLTSIDDIFNSNKSNDEIRQEVLSHISALSEYVNMADIDVVLPRNGGMILKQIKRDANRNIIKENGNIVSNRILTINPEDITKGTIIEAFKSVFSQLEVPIRINKKLITKDAYKKALFNSNAAITFANTSTPKDATVYFRVPSITTNGNNTTTNNNNTEINVPTSVQENQNTTTTIKAEDNLDDLGDVFNFMSDNTIQTVTSKELNEIGLELDTNYNITDILNLIDNVDTPLDKEVLKTLIRNASEGNITYRFENNPDIRAYGQYTNGTVTLYVGPNNPNFIHSLLHETIHAFTSYIIESNDNNLSSELKEAKAQLKTILNEARKNGVINEFGATTSLHEFIAELSNPKFVEQLDKIEYPNTKISFFNRIINAIKKIFGLSNSSLSNKATEVLKKFISTPLVSNNTTNNMLSTNNNKEFSTTNNNIYYMKRTEDDIFSNNEIVNIIRSYRGKESSSISSLEEDADMINALVGKNIARVFSLRSDYYNRPVFALAIDKLPADELERLDRERLLKESKSESMESRFETERLSLLNYGYSEEDLEMFTSQDMIDYAKQCFEE